MRISAVLAMIVALFPGQLLAANIHSSRLSNGLQIIVREDHRAPVVLSAVWYKVGGSYETNGITGISHVLEHMMFKGTEKFGPGAFNKTIADVGGKQNAMTGEDYTVYYQELPSDKLELSFQMEADRMHNLLLDKAAFEKEKQVVMEERRMRVDDNPQGKTWEHFRATAFVNSPYHHPVIGWMTDLQNLTIQNVQDWYKKWYAPNNAVLIVVGDVKFDRVFQLAKKYFGPLKAGRIPKLKPRREVPSLGRKVVNIKVHANTPWLMMGYNVPTLPTVEKQNQNEIYALKLATYILDSGESARLATDLIRKKRLAVSANANFDLYNLHDSLFVLMGIPSPKHSLSELQDALLNQIEELKSQPISQKELDRVKAQLLADDVYQSDSLMRMSFRLGVPLMVGLSWRDREDFIKKISAITPAEVQNAVKKYLVSNNLTVANLDPMKG